MRRLWSYFEIVLLDIAYWTGHLPPDHFYVNRGNCYLRLELYHKAIRDYKRASKDSKDPRILDTINYCYQKIGADDDGMNFYRKANKKVNEPSVSWGLANAEFDKGNFDRSQELIREIRSKHHINSQRLDIFEAQIEIAKRERKSHKHMEDEFETSKK